MSSRWLIRLRPRRRRRRGVVDLVCVGDLAVWEHGSDGIQITLGGEQRGACGEQFGFDQVGEVYSVVRAAARLVIVAKMAGFWVDGGIAVIGKLDVGVPVTWAMSLRRSARNAW